MVIENIPVFLTTKHAKGGWAQTSMLYKDGKKEFENNAFFREVKPEFLIDLISKDQRIVVKE